MDRDKWEQAFGLHPAVLVIGSIAILLGIIILAFHLY